MTDAQIYVALIDKSIAYNREHDLDINTCEPNVFYSAALEILQSIVGTGKVGEFLNEVDRIREAQRKEKN